MKTYGRHSTVLAKPVVGHNHRFESVWSAPTCPELKSCLIGTAVVTLFFFLVILPILPIIQHSSQSQAPSKINCTSKPYFEVGRPHVASMFSFHPENHEERLAWPITADPDCPAQSHVDIYSMPLTNASLQRELNRAMWSVFRPRISCPVKLLQLVGDPSLGGKFVCGLGVFKDTYCLVYSFGIENDAMFEKSLAKNATMCRFYLYDPRVLAHKELPKRFKFKPVQIAAEDGMGKRTLKSFLRINAHFTRDLDLLKLDIDGNEFSVIDNIFKDFPREFPVNQVLLRVNLVESWNITTFSRVASLFRKMEELGLHVYSRTFSNKGNGGGGTADFGLININSNFWLAVLENAKK